MVEHSPKILASEEKVTTSRLDSLSTARNSVFLISVSRFIQLHFFPTPSNITWHGQHSETDLLWAVICWHILPCMTFMVDWVFENEEYSSTATLVYSIFSSVIEERDWGTTSWKTQWWWLIPCRQGFWGRLMVNSCTLVGGCRDRFLMRSTLLHFGQRFGLRISGMLLALSASCVFLLWFHVSLPQT